MAGDAPSFEDSQSANSYYADEERRLWRANADALTALDAEFSAATKALSEENSARLRALTQEQAAAYQDLSAQGLTGEARTAAYKRLQDDAQQKRAEQLTWYQSERQRLSDEHQAKRAAQLAGTQQQIVLTQQQRVAAMARISGVPIGLTATEESADIEAAAGDEAPVAKSGATGYDLYWEHCETCHSDPGTYTWRYDLYEAVVVDDAAYFLDRVRNGPGNMPDIDAIQALSDAQIYSIRDYIRERGDYNTARAAAAESGDDSGDDSGLPVPDGPAKTPDSGQPPSPLPAPGAVVGGQGSRPPPGVPSMTPDSPLAGQGPAGSAVVRDAQTESFGTASLSCNVSQGVEARWIAPYSWRSGWIPPGGRMEGSGDDWDGQWLLRFRARLEEPTDSTGSLQAGWCRFTTGSLGSVAGKGRDIVVFAHAPAASFEQFRFGDTGVSVVRADPSRANRSSRYAIDVVEAVYGVYLRAGGRQTGSGEVHGTVRRIDDRWGDEGAIAFLVVNN